MARPTNEGNTLMGLLNRGKEKPTPDPDELLVLLAELDAGDIRSLAEFNEAAASIAKARVSADAITGDIDSPESYSAATDAMKFLDDAMRDVEALRKKVKRSFDNGGKLVQSSFVELKGSADAARKSLEQRALAFEDRRQREEQERREAEEAEARKREAEAKREGDEQAAQRAREEVHRATAPQADVSGARGETGAKASPTSELKYDITDEDALPDAYVKRVPDRAKILEAVRQGVIVPGVHVYRDRKVRVR